MKKNKNVKAKEKTKKKKSLSLFVALLSLFFPSNKRAPGRVDGGPLEAQGVLQGLRARRDVVVLDNPAEFHLKVFFVWGVGGGGKKRGSVSETEKR